MVFGIKNKLVLSCAENHGDSGIWLSFRAKGVRLARARVCICFPFSVCEASGGSGVACRRYSPLCWAGRVRGGRGEGTGRFTHVSCPHTLFPPAIPLPPRPASSRAPPPPGEQEAIRKNFILVYELLDETLDYGYPQGTSTETLKNHVRNEPILVDSVKSMRLPSVREESGASYIRLAQTRSFVQYGCRKGSGFV